MAGTQLAGEVHQIDGIDGDGDGKHGGPKSHVTQLIRLQTIILKHTDHDNALCYTL